ncbi:hypothetical protein [Rhodococcus sp. BE178]|uniref:hypothetical protein n=1 Tax=Rhodococcus sp. BE178 TaxID=2817737 RepID=UPI003D1EE929
MQIFTPSAWEGASVVTVVIMLALLHGLALVRGWIVWGPAHREIVRLKDDAITHSQGREQADQDTIRTLADTIAEQKVASQLAAHASQSFRDAVGQAP